MKHVIVKALSTLRLYGIATVIFDWLLAAGDWALSLPPVLKVRRRKLRTPRTCSEHTAEIQELEYLRPLLESLPDPRIAIDVGANTGSITKALASMGLKVYSFEPSPETRQHLIGEVGDLIRAGRVQVLEPAISDHDGSADMFLSSAAALNTLEIEWTRIAFPEYFRNQHTIRVPVRKLASLLPGLGINEVGFVKIDTEGHESNVLRGLFEEQVDLKRPSIIMFEANQRFPRKLQECLDILVANGYKQFDIFVKAGKDLLSAGRFEGTQLPKEWREYGQRYFYANIIAYHSAYLVSIRLPGLPVV